MPHPLGLVDLGRPPAGVLHTIEGSLESGISVFEKRYTPTFGVGRDRIVQFTALGQMDAALENHYGGGETNRWARAQIEVEGHAQEYGFSFAPAVTDALASLLATLRAELGIPLTRPFPDAMQRLPWSTESFSRRRAGKWGKVAGWYGHVEIPENSHWDPGALLWTPLLAEAKRRIPLGVKLKPYYAVRVVRGQLRRA